MMAFVRWPVCRVVFDDRENKWGNIRPFQKHRREVAFVFGWSSLGQVGGSSPHPCKENIRFYFVFRLVVIPSFQTHYGDGFELM